MKVRVEALVTHARAPRSGVLWVWLPVLGLLWVLSGLVQAGASGAGSGGAEVARAGFCLNVTNLEPDAFIEAIGPEVDRVLFFSELVGLDGRTVIHRWRAGEAVLLEVAFAVAGERWRVYSAKQLLAEAGQLTVEIVLDDGAGGVVLARHHLPILAAADF